MERLVETVLLLQLPDELGIEPLRAPIAPGHAFAGSAALLQLARIDAAHTRRDVNAASLDIGEYLIDRAAGRDMDDRENSAP